MVQLSDIALRWASDPANPDWPTATILVNGADPFAGQMRGFDPGDIFAPDRPLSPDRQGRRVAVARCRCGEAGCGVAAPIIRASSDGVVSWTDFRTFTGVFAGPRTDQDEVEGGKALAYPNLYFDARAYAEEVDRATLDRTWETPRRAAARLVAQGLEEMLPARWHLEWVSPAWRAEGVSISLTDRFDNGQVKLHLVGHALGGPDAADEIIEQLKAVPAAQWPAAFG